MLHVSGEIVRAACLTGRFGNSSSLTAVALRGAPRCEREPHHPLWRGALPGST